MTTRSITLIIWKIRMRIEFKLVGKDKEEADLMIPFCEFLVENLKKDIKRFTNIEKLQSYEKTLLSATWIRWIKKPAYLNMEWVLTEIIRSIRYYERRERVFVITIDQSKKLESSRTKLEKIVRFLDKGNISTAPSGMFSKIFNRYQNNINRYWKAFIRHKLHRFPETKAVIIV